MRYFNTEGLCNPNKHYMVDIIERLIEIRKMIDAGKYFVINRGRQYGKTTTLVALRKSLVSDHVVLGLDFQGIGNAGFASEEIFVQEFCGHIMRRKQLIGFIPSDIENKLNEYAITEKPIVRLSGLFGVLNDWCAMSDKPIVLIIDEVDSATNNQVFLDFLAQLRDGYLLRESDDIPTFQSVILAGVTDVKHLKSKIRDDAQKQLLLYGFVNVVNNKMVVANRIFEMRLYRQFVGETKYDNLLQMAASEKNIFIEDGMLNVPKIMEHFISSQKIIRGEMNEKFIEDEGRESFLTFLSPIISGTGTYSIEEQTRDHRRMDVIIHYLGKRYVIELKIWRGERYNEEGEKQIRGYLDYFGLETGYMLSFNFNKNKEPGVTRLDVDGKVLYEGIV